MWDFIKEDLSRVKWWERVYIERISNQDINLTILYNSHIWQI